MRMRKCSVAFVSSLLLLVAAGAASRFNTEQWSHQARISRPRHNRANTPVLIETALTPEVLNIARPDLADLRVLDLKEKELPYALRSAHSRLITSPLKVKLYNQTYIKGRQSSVVADFGRSVLKNRIEVATPGANFRRKTLVEGSDEGTNWRVVQENEFLFNIRPDSAGGGFAKSHVSLPDNNQRYLRITVFNAPDDTDRVPITDVRAWRYVVQRPDVVAVTIRNVNVEEKAEEKRTDITLDLGYAKMKLHELTLRFSNTDFLRYVTLYGRDREKLIVRTRSEEGPPREKEQEAPWEELTRSALYRFSTGGGSESITLSLEGKGRRYVQARIYNGDDVPLEFEEAEITRLQQYLAYPPSGPGDCTLYFGNKAAAAPEYDIVHYIDRLRKAGLGTAYIGSAVPNPSFTAKEAPFTWGERYSILIWLVLLIALAVLSLVVYREVKAARAG